MRIIIGAKITEVGVRVQVGQKFTWILIPPPPKVWLGIDSIIGAVLVN